MYCTWTSICARINVYLLSFLSAHQNQIGNKRNILHRILHCLEALQVSIVLATTLTIGKYCSNK